MIDIEFLESLEAESSMPSSTSSTNTYGHASLRLFSASTASLSRAHSGAVTLSSETIHLLILAIDEADSISKEHEWEIPIDVEADFSASSSLPQRLGKCFRQFSKC